MKKILLLGDRGKMGTAIKIVFQKDYTVIGKNSSHFNAENFNEVEEMINFYKPEIVINTVAFMGIDPCERQPEKALRLNSLFPYFLANLSKKKNFLLVHFSTDAVFSDSNFEFYTEKHNPCPLNIYGLTKYGGDCFVQNNADKYYLIRIGILFGPTSKKTQFVEKMLLKIKEGEKELRIANDIVTSPSYNIDIAKKIKELIENQYPYGLYHVSNSGKASLFELMKEIVRVLSLDVDIKIASYKDFPHIGQKNRLTPLISIYLSPMRFWKAAVEEYCTKWLSHIKNEIL